ncbi:MAG: peptidylprolyl isomerase [Bacteroidales bacterium]|nr:peptidylprolyl isomerase [Bacteroidales bacterium]
MKIKNTILLLIFSLLIALVACDDDDDRSYDEQLAYEIGKIQDYAVDSNLSVIATESGLHYIIEEQGTGSYPTIDSIVEVKYRGRYLNGNEFDSGTTEGNVAIYIKGWQEGIPLFREGSKGMLFIPSALGYGISSKYIYGIYDNSTLVFNIEILEVRD